MEFIYEGKAKQVFKADQEGQVVIHYKDDATAGNGAKKGTIANKGILNNRITAIIFNYLQQNDVPTHFIKVLNERDQLCKEVKIFPLEVIVRNVIAGSAAIRYKISEGTNIKQPILEICWKDDELGDPLINDYHAISFNLATREQLDEIYHQTKIINDLLIKMWKHVGIKLIDFKIEFGLTNDNQIVLADEISPDTCRLWDIETNEKLDKDRFRRDLGNIEEAYHEICNRLEELVK